ncbi:hypothetical protein KXV80_005029 [Aspergillus fumigatus]|nr:hypothetical protein KXV80_005029 [Aspergillus fumigatus]
MARLMDTIKKDHRELEEYYKIIVSSRDTDEQIRFQNKFTWELARHAIGEELVVYPALEKYLPGGAETADKDQKLQKFQDMHPSDAAFMPILKSMMADLEKHIEEEETIDFVKLEDAITPKESESLSKSYLADIFRKWPDDVINPNPSSE